jgi:hypothetical protein
MNARKINASNGKPHSTAGYASQAAAFLRARFAGTPADLYALVWTKKGKRSDWLTVGQLAEAENLLSPFCTTGAGDVYAGVGLSLQDFGPTNRCAAEAVAGITGLWCDIDVCGPTHKATNLPATLEDAQELARSLGLPPTLEVFSGYGLQPYWEFTSSWIFRDDADRERAADLARRFQELLRENAKARGWTLDSTHDLARVLRLPGTFNCKGDEPVSVRVLDAGGPRYEVGDFLALLPPKGVGTETPTKAGHGLRYRTNAPPVAERARKYVARMPEAVEGKNGHDATWAVVLVLVRGFSLSDDEARRILAEYNQRCVPPWSEKELEHKLKSVRDKSNLPDGYLLRRDSRPNGPTESESAAHHPVHLTDRGNAIRLVRMRGEGLRHCHKWRKWLNWTGERWEIDATAEVTRAAKAVPVALWRSASAEIARLAQEAEEEQDP